MSLRGWEILKCECGSEHFQQVFKLSWHEGQGTSMRPDGYFCSDCQRLVNTQKMINVAEEKVLKAKIKELQGENS